MRLSALHLRSFPTFVSGGLPNRAWLERGLAVIALFVALALGACQTLDVPYSRDGELPAAVAVADASPERARLNAEVFEALTTWVDALYYDPKVGGRDWAALTARYRDGVLSQTTEEGLYRQLEEMLDELDDRHTSAISPSSRALRAAQRREESVVGYGMSVLRDGEDHVVVRLRAEGAAAEAGVQIGWRVVTVNGLEPSRSLVPSLTRTDVFVFLDENDAEHRLSLTGRPIEVRPQREAIRRDDAIEILRFDGFNAESHDWMAEQRARLAVDPPRAVVLDLRDNPGGRFDILGDMVASFMPEKVPFAVMLGRWIDRRYFTTAMADPWTGPLAVLVGPGSGSASELFAAAVQDLDRGPVVGRKTAGAVIGSRQINLPDGGELSVSTVAILTNDRTLLEKVGVTPDIVTDPSLADLRAGRDPTLLAAIAALDLDDDESVRVAVSP